jgi:hypothetical protein
LEVYLYFKISIRAAQLTDVLIWQKKENRQLETSLPAARKQSCGLFAAKNQAACCSA